MPTLVGLLVHACSYWAPLWLLHIPPTAALICYLTGAAVLCAATWYPKLRLTSSQSVQLVGYSVLLSALVFGANGAREILGNSVRVNRTYQSSMEPYLFLAPGVASIGLGALVASLLRKAASREA